MCAFLIPDGIHQQKLLVSCPLDGMKKAVFPTIEVADGHIVNVHVESCEDGSGSSHCRKCVQLALETFLNAHD